MSRLGQLIRIETLKARKRVALWVTTGVLAFLCCIGVLMPLSNAIQGGDSSFPFAFPFVWRSALQVPGVMGPLFLGVLTILLMAPEFGWKTARQNVIDGLSREQFYVGKVVVLVQLLLLFMIIPILITIVAVLLSPDQGPGAFVEATDLNRLLGYLLALALWGSVGFLLAALIRSAGAAAGAMLLYYLVENILRNLIRLQVPEAEPYLGFLPTGIFDTLDDLNLYYPEMLAAVNAIREENGGLPLEYPELWMLAAALLAWVAAFMALAFFVTRRRDL